MTDRPTGLPKVTDHKHITLTDAKSEIYYYIILQNNETVSLRRSWKYLVFVSASRFVQVRFKALGWRDHGSQCRRLGRVISKRHALLSLSTSRAAAGTSAEARGEKKPDRGGRGPD